MRFWPPKWRWSIHPFFVERGAWYAKRCMAPQCPHWNMSEHCGFETRSDLNFYHSLLRISILPNLIISWLLLFQGWAIRVGICSNSSVCQRSFWFYKAVYVNYTSFAGNEIHKAQRNETKESSLWSQPRHLAFNNVIRWNRRGFL